MSFLAQGKLREVLKSTGEARRSPNTWPSKRPGLLGVEGKTSTWYSAAPVGPDALPTGSTWARECILGHCERLSTLSSNPRVAFQARWILAKISSPLARQT